MMKHVLTLILIAILTSCTHQPRQPEKEPVPPSNITNTPDLRAYSALTTRDANGIAADYELVFSSKADFTVYKTGSNVGRLYIQPNECRNQDEMCERKFIITGDFTHNKNNLKCFFELRNDLNEGYKGQVIEGLCRDRFNRNYASSIHQ